MFLDTMLLQDVTEADLRRLIDQPVSESRQLDYKREPGGGGDKAKFEFLKDITAFANTLGGYLIVGIAEVDGVPNQFSPIQETSADDLKLRYFNLLRDNVEPRLFGVEMQDVPVEGGGFVLIVKVPASWNPPHRVTVQNHSRYFLRHSSGADEMDVDQLRAVFLNSSQVQARTRAFRQARVDLVKAGNGPLCLVPPGLALVHVMSIGGTVRAADVARTDERPMLLSAHGVPSYSTSINFDGVLTVSSGLGGHAYQYVQLFRDGSIEAAMGRMVFEPHHGGPPRVRYADLADGIVSTLPGYLEMLGRVGFGPPFVVFVSLLNVKGSRLPFDPFGATIEISQDDLLPDPVEVVSARLDGDWQGVIRPILDRIWNACGSVGTPDFDAMGRWAPDPGLRR